MRHSSRRCSGRTLKMAVASLVLVSVLVGNLGLGCNHDASVAFRDAATTPVGDGVKGVVNGLLDGLIAAIQAAGGDSASSSSSTNGSTNTGTST